MLWQTWSPSKNPVHRPLSLGVPRHLCNSDHWKSLEDFPPQTCTMSRSWYFTDKCWLPHASLLWHIADKPWLLPTSLSWHMVVKSSLPQKTLAWHIAHKPCLPATSLLWHMADEFWLPSTNLPNTWPAAYIWYLQSKHGKVLFSSQIYLSAQCPMWQSIWKSGMVSTRPIVWQSFWARGQIFRWTAAGDVQPLVDRRVARYSILLDLDSTTLLLLRLLTPPSQITSKQQHRQSAANPQY